VVCCLIAYGIMVNRTAADFSSDVDLATQYRALLSAHEETKITVDALKRDAMVPAAKVDASLVSLQQDLNKMTDAVEQAAMARATLLKAHSNMQASVKKMETETSTTSKELQKKAAELQAKTQEHLRELTTTLDSLKQQFEAIKSKDISGELGAIRANLVAEAVKEALKEIKSEESRVSSSVQKTSENILKSVKKDLMAEVKMEVEKMLARRVNDQVHEAVTEHKGASSLLTWFDSGKGRMNDERMELAVKSVLAKLYAERLGKVDWLLGVNGARILTSSDTDCNSGEWFDAAFCKISPSLSAVQLNANSILQGDVQTDTTWLETSSAMLGNCWAMKGSKGHVEVELAKAITATEFVVQHAPASITPDQGRSAPRHFRIQGRVSAQPVSTNDVAKNNTLSGEAGSWVTLVDGEYELKDIVAEAATLTPHMQSFKVGAAGAVDAIRFEVLDNHGGEAFTCLYHLRMYGDP